MAKKVTQHYGGGKHIERVERTRSDGSRTITESKVRDTSLGRAGSSIVRETRIDKHGNSTTKKRR